MPTPVQAGTPPRTPRRVLILCLICITVEGYDIASYGAALPSILAYQDWGLTVGQAGLIGSLTPIGMLVGAGASGLLTDSLGRRRVILVGITIFTAAALLSALAPNPAVFGASRAVVGLGVGAVLPTISALIYEYSVAHRRNLNAAIVFSGTGIGGVIGAVVAATLIPAYGFRVEFLIGGIAGIVLLPIVFRYLPESAMFLRSAGRTEEADRLAAQLDLDPHSADGAADRVGRSLTASARIRVLISPRYRLTTILLWLSMFVSLLLIFGITTWLPVLMSSAGYSLGSALSFLLVLNLGVVAGPLLVARFADAVGSRIGVTTSFLLVILGMVCLSFPLPTAVQYLALAAVGTGISATQILLNVLVGNRYPTEVRATAIGIALSVGRLGAIIGPVFGSVLLSAQLHPSVNFYAFAGPALLGLLCAVLVPVPRRDAPVGTGAHRTPPAKADDSGDRSGRDLGPARHGSPQHERNHPS